MQQYMSGFSPHILYIYGIFFNSHRIDLSAEIQVSFGTVWVPVLRIVDVFDFGYLLKQLKQRKKNISTVFKQG